MNRLDVGVNKGLSKTKLAVARADGHVLLEARLEHFDPTDPRPITDERLLQVIAQHLAPFKAHPLHLFGGHVGTTRSFLVGLRAYGLKVEVLEAFNDTHGHYRLTDMPGNAVPVACGSYWNAMYYDGANNVHCFASPRAIWDELDWNFSGMTFARYLLWLWRQTLDRDTSPPREAWWSQTWVQGVSPTFLDEIVARTGLSSGALREKVDHDPLLKTLAPPHWLALSPLISQYAREQSVATFLDHGMSELQQLYERFCAQVHPPSLPLLVLGGSIWSSVLFERAQRDLTRAGIPVMHSQGNPALGAIRFRHANPTVRLEPWAYRVTR